MAAPVFCCASDARASMLRAARIHLRWMTAARSRHGQQRPSRGDGRARGSPSRRFWRVAIATRGEAAAPPTAILVDLGSRRPTALRRRAESSRHANLRATVAQGASLPRIDRRARPRALRRGPRAAGDAGRGRRHHFPARRPSAALAPTPPTCSGSAPPNCSAGAADGIAIYPSGDKAFRCDCLLDAGV